MQLNPKKIADKEQPLIRVIRTKTPQSIHLANLTLDRFLGLCFRAYRKSFT